MKKVKRKVIKIDGEKCTGCGECIPDCPEGALQLIDGKARLISDLFCDGLGACIGSCPVDAISVEEREAEPYDEKKVMKNIVKAGKNTITAHLKHLKGHNQMEYLHQAMAYLKENKADFPIEAEMHGGHGKHSHDGACPGSKPVSWGDHEPHRVHGEKPASGIKHPASVPSELRNWPVQITLVNPHASYLKNAELLISADCVPFAYAGFHQDFVKDKVVLMGCPKLDDIEFYKEKLTQIFKTANPMSITVARMEVPCCGGLVTGVQEAIKKSGKKIPFCEITVSIKGEAL
ncbi:MAG: 4Fe-4S binding protein [bacterium]